jgi:hypothetical protein
MGRRVATAAVVVVAVCLAGTVPASAQAPQGDSVVGIGFANSFFGLDFTTIDARSGPSGEQPSGSVRWLSYAGIGTETGGTVTCLSVTGARAIIGFSGYFTLAPLRIPVAGLIRVVDGGGPASRQDTFEWAQVEGEDNGPPIAGPTDCSSYPSTFTPNDRVFVNEYGDLVVTDARAVPTSKDQCKHGGWKTFGVFKNQGDCVSYVLYQAIRACVSERAAIGQRAFRQKYGIGRFDLFAMLRCVHQGADG